jgi:hypothetical protein
MHIYILKQDVNEHVEPAGQFFYTFPPSNAFNCR